MLRNVEAQAFFSRRAGLTNLTSRRRFPRRCLGIYAIRQRSSALRSNGFASPILAPNCIWLFFEIIEKCCHYDVRQSDDLS